MALQSNALTTVARLKTWMGITTSANDTVLESVINAVSQYLENKCHRKFKQQTHTNELIDSDGDQDLFLKNYPIDSVNSLQKRRNKINSDSWDSLDTADFYVDKEAGILTVSGRFHSGVGKYRCTYVAGYDFDLNNSFPPADLEMIVWKIATIWFNIRKDGDNIKRIRLGDYDVEFAKIVEENAELSGMIDNYMRYSF